MKLGKAAAALLPLSPWPGFFVCMFFACLVLPGTPCCAQGQGQRSISVIFFDQKDREACRFFAEPALTPGEWERGLMFKTYMRRRTGMLFMDDRDAMQYFWMKNTYIPLDMVFINSRREVVHVHANARPNDERTISSRYPARYVLEINAGEAKECSIKRGYKARFGDISMRP